VTAFATVINTGPGTAAGCSISPVTSVPATFLYQTTDPVTNALTGTPNAPVDIAEGAAQTFLFVFTPTAVFAPTDIQLAFDCTNTDPAPTTAGLNTFLLSASNTPVADIVALSATPLNDGVVHIPDTGPPGAFSVATVNLGAAELITARAEAAAGALPLNLSLCETNPATGVCANPPTPAVEATIMVNTGATPTLAVFADATDQITLDPARNRIRVSFFDNGGASRGSTSVAVEGGQPVQNNPGMPWVGSWLLVNFLTTEETQFSDDDDLSGIGFTAIITETTWTEIDDAGCTVNYALSVDSNLGHTKTATSVSGCPFGNDILPLLNETGWLEFEGDFMNEYWDLQPGDDLAAFRWFRQ
jgi:hypothetical protein